MFKIVITVDECVKIPIIVKAVNDQKTITSFSTSGDNNLENILQDLGLKKVSLAEILPKYKKVSADLLNHECVICNQMYKQNEYFRKLNCNHHFHKKCIDKWLKKNPSCPICRKDII